MSLLPTFTVFVFVLQNLSAYTINVVDPSVSFAFITSKLVPDVLPTTPQKIIKITFPSGVEVSLGNELTPRQVKDLPSVSYEAESDEFYTFIFVDPDNYQGPETVYSEWRHWLVGNIPGSDLSKGDNLVEFISSGPSEGSGLHRYVFCLFKQPGKIQFEETRLTNTSLTGREGFSIQKFAEKYSLGAAVAGNFYLAGYDDYVPELVDLLS